MSTVQEIKKAISGLSLQEKLELHAWEHPVEEDDWDRQMDADSAAGRLDFVFKESAQGTTPFPQGELPK